VGKTDVDKSFNEEIKEASVWHDYSSDQIGIHFNSISKYKLGTEFSNQHFLITIFHMILFEFTFVACCCRIWTGFWPSYSYRSIDKLATISCYNRCAHKVQGEIVEKKENFFKKRNKENDANFPHSEFVSILELYWNNGTRFTTTGSNNSVRWSVTPAPSKRLLIWTSTKLSNYQMMFLKMSISRNKK
jgi:hypothetical protein